MNQENIFRFLPHPQIVAIDNDPEHLDLITNGLLSMGLPTVPIRYSMVEGINPPENWDPNRVRILFLDLNLKDFEHPREAISGIAEPIKEVLEALSPTGPFVIGFWTKLPKLVIPVMEALAERYKDTELSLPVTYKIIDKAPFLPIDGQHDHELLRNEIFRALDHKLFLALLAWESGIENAAALTLEMICSFVNDPQPNGTSLDDNNLQDVIINLAKTAWGKKMARDNPGGAVTRGLAPLLIDNMDGIVEDAYYFQIWKNAIDRGWNRGLPEMVSSASLNSRCLVDLNCRLSEIRGAWLVFTEEAFREEERFKGNFNLSKEDLVDEFINPGDAEDADDAKASVRLGLLECTAACDLINDKAPLHRYFLCAMIPAEFKEYICWENPIRDRKHDAIHEIETIHFEGQNFILFVNFRFALSLAPSHELLKPEIITGIFRVRNQVLADIAARYASHTTRPGFYFFRSK